MTSYSSSNIVPVDGLSFEVIMLKVVDFPAPLGPNNPKIYPTSIPNDVPLTA